MANNKYKSSILDSLALQTCVCLVNVISLHCDNQVKQLKASKYEGNTI